MIMLDLFGDPVALSRPKFFKKGPHIGCYDPQAKLKEGYRWQLKGIFREKPILSPVALDITFFMPIPKSTSKTKKKQMENGLISHMCKPDLDNLQKFIIDCMNGLVFKDDAQIVEIRAKKIYANKTGTLVRLFPLANTETSLLYENIARKS